MNKPTNKYTGQRGRKPLTDKQKQDATYAEKPKDNALKAHSFLPLPDAALCAEAKSEWLRVGEYLLLTDRVAKLDTQALTFYATSYAIFSEAARQMLVGRESLWGRVNGRPKSSKMVDMVLHHGSLTIRMARKFGMTARTRHLDHKKGPGRPATPQQIHDLRGTSHKRPSGLGRGVQHVGWDVDAIARPVWFSRDASDQWDRMVEQLESLDLWTPLDVVPIAVLCGCYSLAAKCAVQMSDEPLVLAITDSEAMVEHPLSSIYRDLFLLCEAIWQDYGMTPHDRQQFFHSDGEQQGKPKLAVFPGELA